MKKSRTRCTRKCGPSSSSVRRPLLDPGEAAGSATRKKHHPARTAAIVDIVLPHILAGAKRKKRHFFCLC